MRLSPIASGAFIIAVVLVGIIGVSWAAGAAYQNTAPESTKVVDEEMTADVGNWTRVDAPDYALSFLDNETIDESSGTTLTEGEDYDWNTSTGKVLFYDTSNVDDGELMTLTYVYESHTRNARAARDVTRMAIRYALPSGILIAIAVSISGLAVAIVRWYGGGSNLQTKNFGR